GVVIRRCLVALSLVSAIGISATRRCSRKVSIYITHGNSEIAGVSPAVMGETGANVVWALLPPQRGLGGMRACKNQVNIAYPGAAQKRKLVPAEIPPGIAFAVSLDLETVKGLVGDQVDNACHRVAAIQGKIGRASCRERVR